MSIAHHLQSFCAEEHEGGEDDQCAGKFKGRAESRIRPDKVGEDLRAEDRPDQTPQQTHNRVLPRIVRVNSPH